jgi:histidyl-tRNA synthetase
LRIIFYKDLGLPVEVHINSIGMPEEGKNIRPALVEYYRSKRSYLCDDCKQRLTKNPLRLLDCKQEKCQPVKEEAPQIIAWLEEEFKETIL